MKSLRSKHRLLQAIRTLAIVAIANLVLAATAIAQSQDGPPQGWLWYREAPPAPPKKPEKNSVKVDAVPAPTASAPAPMAGSPSTWTTAMIRNTLPRLQDEAVQNPTPENVHAFLALQHMALDRSQRFAEVALKVTQSDPGLDENTRHPLASAAESVSVQNAQVGLLNGIQNLAQHAGLFFFFRSDCPYCHQDLSVLRTLELTTGIKVIGVSLDGENIDDNLFPNFLIDNGQALRLGVQSTPAFFLVRPPNMTDVVEIGQGYLSLDELEQRIIEQAYYRGWINADYYEKSRIAKPMDLRDEQPGNPGDLSDGDIQAIQAAVSKLPPSPLAQNDQAASSNSN